MKSYLQTIYSLFYLFSVIEWYVNRKQSDNHHINLSVQQQIT